MSDTSTEKKMFSKKGCEFIEWLLGRYPDKQAVDPGIDTPIRPGTSS